MAIDVEPVRTEQIEFGSLIITYDERVLRPRRWTTAQSAWASGLLREAPEGPALELCSGVGHIGLLALIGESRKMVMVDASDVACGHAEANAERAGLAAKVDIRCGRMEQAIGEEERFALIIADPPWVPSRDTARFPDDPVLAIDGGPDGLDLARTCVELIGRHLHDRGSALLQVGTAEQLATISDHLFEEPALRLRIAEYRTFEDRGVLARLVRPDS
ncbi:methyltransferase [Aeromicrobium sp. A1-2]|uniref:methyltransferase n=1 Tax=Aeromicrobium sp. A1-2 TaxID=2107713 RepID=UPI000E49F342|nr:methyltransferase [Aeromicrobium sp. A1-2]AXT86335.1 methyltransferase [Aeromicrobium sp. A1-2]